MTTLTMRMTKGDFLGGDTLENAAGIGADLTIGISQARSVTHQSACLDKFTQRIGRGDPADRRLEGKLDTPVHQKSRDRGQQGVGSLSHKSFKDRINLAASADFENLHLQPHRARGPFHVSQCRLGTRRVGWLDEHSNPNGCGHQLAQ